MKPFTVAGALHNNNSWIGAGKWEDNATLEAAKKKKAEPVTPREETDKPPVLHHRTESKAPAPASAAPASPTPPVSETPQAKPPTTAAASTASPTDDANRPMLRRGKPTPAPLSDEQELAAFKSAVGKGPVQIIPAVSDAGGLDPRSYAFIMKPGEEETFRKKMLAMASDEVRARIKQLSTAMVGAAPPRRTPPGKTAASKLPAINFENIQLHVLDLSAANEPVLVLTAQTKMPPSAGKEKTSAEPILFITLVAREDIYGDLHKAFSSVTDAQHLDALPRMELIDAVDADGDGRGELLFRETSDAGSAFSIYRVIGNQLWPLFQGTPGK